MWFRRSDSARTAAQQDVTTLVEQAGGRVLSSAIIEEIGYHAIKCLVPNNVLVSLAHQNFDQVQVVKSANVLFLRVTGQTVLAESPTAETSVVVDSPKPALPPVVCLLDGVPASNHSLLNGRVTVYDPDDLSSESSVAERKHGTWMSSTVVWGDRNAGEEPATRQVLVRPILAPSSETIDRREELPSDALIPDLMWRAFRDLFEPKDGRAPVAPDVAIINLSVGDPSTPFDTIMSSWARMIDWLSYHYGVLVIVSAGNHHRLPLTSSSISDLSALTGDDRRQAVLRAQSADYHNRRLISPAESVNAVTVGAVHADESGPLPGGYILDPADGLTSISPVTSLGGGYRRSIKPDLAAAGGRVVYTDRPSDANSVMFKEGVARGPGIRVASPGTNKEAYIAGTSPATALVTRRASNLYDTIDEITDGISITRRQRAVAIKALLIHGTEDLSDFATDAFPVEHALGNGVLVRDYSRGCASNEAVVLYIGTLGASEEQELLLPLPNGLSIRETKRISATLGWISPVNWQHRQYRQAALSFVKPYGAIPALPKPVGRAADVVKRGATTVQHLDWEMQSAFASGQGSNLRIRVKCFEQAGGLNGERIDYAVALSLWVAPILNVNVYTQVREQIHAQVSVQPGS